MDRGRHVCSTLSILSLARQTSSVMPHDCHREGDQAGRYRSQPQCSEPARSSGVIFKDDQLRPKLRGLSGMAVVEPALFLVRRFGRTTRESSCRQSDRTLELPKRFPSEASSSGRNGNNERDNCLTSTRRFCGLSAESCGNPEPLQVSGTCALVKQNGAVGWLCR